MIDDGKIDWQTKSTNIGTVFLIIKLLKHPCMDVCWLVILVVTKRLCYTQKKTINSDIDDWFRWEMTAKHKLLLIPGLIKHSRG